MDDSKGAQYGSIQLKLELEPAIEKIIQEFKSDGGFSPLPGNAKEEKVQGHGPYGASSESVERSPYSSARMELYDDLSLLKSKTENVLKLLLFNSWSISAVRTDTMSEMFRTIRPFSGFTGEILHDIKLRDKELKDVQKAIKDKKALIALQNRLKSILKGSSANAETKSKLRKLWKTHVFARKEYALYLKYKAQLEKRQQEIEKRLKVIKESSK